MAISRVGTPTSTGSSTNDANVTTSLPAGVQSGDVLILNIFNGTNQAVATGPSGWTFVDFSSDNPGSGTAARVDTFWKAAASSESAPTATLATGARWTAHVAAYRGVDTTSPFIYEDGKQNDANNTELTTSLVTNGVSADAWTTVFAGVRGVDGTWTGFTFPAGLTELVDYDPGGTSTGRIVSAVADSNGALGDTADRQYTLTLSVSTGNGVTWTGVLRPAVVATPPDVPTGLQVTPADTTAEATWTPVSGATSYDVEWELTGIDHAGSAFLSGSGALTTTRQVTTADAGAFSGAGALSTTQQSTEDSSASLFGSGSLTAEGTSVGGEPTVADYSVRVDGVSRPILAVRRDGTNYSFTIRRV